MEEEKPAPQPMIPEQVRNFLGSVDRTHDVQAFMDGINLEHTSDHWESLVFSDDKTALFLTGKPVEACACTAADTDSSPHALCEHCCKKFQEDWFSSLFGEEVEVEISESFLYGSNRCSSILRFPGRAAR